jgi:hypothetical protein
MADAVGETACEAPGRPPGILSESWQRGLQGSSQAFGKLLTVLRASRFGLRHRPIILTLIASFHYFGRFAERARGLESSQLWYEASA